MRFILTAPQQEVVEWRGDMLLVYGEAGAGKTEVLAQRTRRILMDDPHGSSKILGLTFSTQAAGEMQSRVADLPDARDRIVTETTHSFGLSVLRSHGRVLGVPAEPVVYSSADDRMAALHLALADADIIDPHAQTAESLRPLNRAISNSRLLNQDMAQDARWNGHLVTNLRQIYDDYLLAHGALDFDLMLTLTTRLFVEQPQAATLYRQVFEHIHIDEAQDLTVAQWNMLDALWDGQPSNVVLLADPAQSIYGFRGAEPGELDVVADKHASQRIDLVASKRCARGVLEVAYPLLHHGAALPSEQQGSGAPGYAGFQPFQDSQNEAKAVADWVDRLTDTGLKPEATGKNSSLPVRCEDIGVLGRNRFHLAAIVDEFETRGTEHQLIMGDRSLFDTDLFDTGMRAIKLLAASDDLALTSALLTALGMPSDGQQRDVVATLRRAAGGNGPASTLLDLLANYTTNLEGAIDAVAHLNFEGAAENGAQLRADRQFLLDRAQGYCDRTEPGQRTWPGLVRELSSTPRPEDPGVRVSTVHGAKGREFKVVILVGMNQGMFPDHREQDCHSGIAAERRLAYVAVTRALYAVICTRPVVIDVGNGPWRRPPSQFLTEMGLT